ncbi:twitching motility protein PilT [Snodgrassella alvi]|jgi:uncharacterized membrane-anchored protein YjiN (DUF445 family)|uniref:Twitching motility protein PilT n=1 Tax=Snodgrassella alvi TaxID=1196083 RepID=A0A2N9XEC2_9NEIS|nr:MULTISPECIES: DUF445 domain-containing protein [Snodgrassella]PIT07431.1 twitching motility protein PilT [Snodgrassella communis]PIT19710.1 twitching motility protein PilT [Snodgrassella communis]PIT21017.1 twitching motility protein PilT [Snodgrassella communis]PIT45960.1 twitching motility protein PilT [Snodgrassella alvi]
MINTATVTSLIQSQRLRRMRLLATSMLIIACVLFVLSCLLQKQYPAIAYLKAFTEAAMVGALADWFAVTALFRHPLGLPIPHTAILPQKQEKIADEFGRFIENNFLQDKAIASRIYRIHPASKALQWLIEPHNQQQWLPVITRQIPLLLHTATASDVARFCNQLLNHQYSGARLGRTLANILVLAQKQGIDTLLLRALLLQVRQWLQNEQTRAQLEKSLLSWVGKIEKTDPNTWDKLKASLKTTLTAQIDDWVASKALNWADSYIDAVLANPQHTFWRSCRKQLLVTERQLRRNPHWHQRLADGREQILQSTALQQSIMDLWDSFVGWSEYDTSQSNSWWQQQLTRLCTHIQQQASQYPQFMRRLDTRITLCTRFTIRQNKNRVSQFIAEKIKSWDSKQMVDKLELSVGRDLQFIRINGTLVGGFIGLIIYIVSQWLTTSA